MRQSILKISLLFCFIVLGFLGLSAQEINAKVTIDHRKIQGTNVSVFQTLETSLTEFVNSRKWTNEEYLPEERIECNFLVNIIEAEGNNFSGNLTVTARRPIYNASISTTLLNVNDNDFSFTYNEFDQLVFNRNSLTQDLTAIVAFYVYTILGLDADSYKQMGGDPYYNVAMGIVNSAESSNSLNQAGWDRLKSERNRHVLISQLMSSEFRPFRSYFYTYHINGLDQMVEDVESGCLTVLDGLSKLEQVNNNTPSSYAMLLFFEVKSLEIQNMIKNLEMEEAKKKQMVELLKRLDPSRVKAYDRLL